MEGTLNRLRKLRIADWALARWHPLVPYKLKELPFSIYIDPLRNTQELFTRSYAVEEEVQQCLLGLIDQIEFRHFFDIGANIGFYTWLVHAKSPGTTCHLFEPDRHNVRILSKTAKRLGAKNLIINELAVGDHSGKVDFFADNVTGKTGSTTLVYAGKNYSENFFSQSRDVSPVQGVTLDSYTQSLSGPFLIKCDVEGTEDLIISGGLNFIRKNKPHIIVEINRNNKKTLPAYIKTLGYNFRIISKAGMLDQDYYFYPVD
ncbi:FkbM family methyltransferase [Roseomonas frigidaquae]|uniref:FkbM family methyltransferase n=1 Tax=Falsiroseomonas frigidaquae TaxID=487318 RepID=A0ABX1F8P8_9PROT|nr:FkbM family methyltransferase [Falsiroseomonas frigidaquae]NKE48768.1 FkbM family methyltransferase [Falsiroseomonas frigidaquae]